MRAASPIKATTRLGMSLRPSSLQSTPTLLGVHRRLLLAWMRTPTEDLLEPAKIDLLLFILRDYRIHTPSLSHPPTIPRLHQLSG